MLIPSRAFDPSKAWSLAFDGDDYAFLVNSAAVPVVLQSIGNENAYTIMFTVFTTAANGSALAIAWAASGVFFELRTETSTIADHRIPFSIGITSGNLQVGRARSSTSITRLSSTDRIDDGTKKNIRLDFNNNDLTIYINGSLDSSQSFSTNSQGDVSVGAVNCNMTIGARTTNTGALANYCTADLLNFAIFSGNPPMFKQDVRLTGREKNLVAYWPFLDKTGTTLKDWSNNKIDGTITGANWQRGV